VVPVPVGPVALRALPTGEEMIEPVGRFESSVVPSEIVAAR
jgi:hypothetical protein